MSIRDLIKAFEEGARELLELLLRVPCRLHSRHLFTDIPWSHISNNIIDISGGNLLLTLIMAMVACIVLGMGLPTTANYIVCSTIIAPALIGMNVMPLSAHLFVFYFGSRLTLHLGLPGRIHRGGHSRCSPSKTGFNCDKDRSYVLSAAIYVRI
jgi:TRAP-type uncharacterized transport system fused permease subunit